MSEKIVTMLYNYLSEANDKKGIKYADSKIIITKNTKDNLKEE